VRIEMSNASSNKSKKYKRIIMNEVENRQLTSVMNNTKWSELQREVEKLPFPPPYILRGVLDDTEIEYLYDDVFYIGDWTDEVLKPFFSIEWLMIRPRYAKHRGRYVKPEIIDETEMFLKILIENDIPYEESNGSYFIYGYK
jgi:hypothetical protein